MLFPYVYVPHSMEKMQEYINYIFIEIWCQAPVGKKFEFELFNGKPDLKELMEGFFYSDTKGADFFMETLKKFIILFRHLQQPKYHV